MAATSAPYIPESPESPVISRLPHVKVTPPTSPGGSGNSTHQALLALTDPTRPGHPRQTSSYASDHYSDLEESGGGGGSGQKAGGEGNGWTWSWSGLTSPTWARSGSGSSGGRGRSSPKPQPHTAGLKTHHRDLSSEETFETPMNEPTKRLRHGRQGSLSARIGEVGGGMVGMVKRRMSGVGGVRRLSGEGRRDGEGEGRLGKVGRAVEKRVRGVEKGNWPFLIVFIACLFIFGSALAGLGYHPPPDVPSTSAAGFELGKPVHEPVERRSEAEIMAERRKMEELWGKMKRPKDGAWMKKGRDDGARRRVQAQTTAEDEPQAVHTAVQDRPAPIDPAIREAEAERAAE